MFVKTVRDYRDIETKEIFRTTDENLIREVSDERGEILVGKGVCIQVLKAPETKGKKAKIEKEVKEEQSITEDVIEESSDKTEKVTEEIPNKE